MITVSHQATMNVYHNSVWFSKNTITNIKLLRNLDLQYLLTHRSNDMMFIICREYEVKTNIQFIMHESGMCYSDPRDQEFTFLSPYPKTNKVSEQDISRVQMPLGLSTPHSYILQTRTTSGLFAATI